jgi:hypothetical protein
MSHILDDTTVGHVLDVAAPMLDAARGNNALGLSGFLHVVIVDPSRHAFDTAFDDAILHERSFGDRSRWDAPYDEFARAKARLAWRCRMDSALVQTRFPHLLVQGDILVGGGVHRHGITVGISGLDPWYDEAMAAAIAGLLRAAAQVRRDKAAASSHILGI